MTGRPRASAAVIGTLAGALPPRIAKRLDANPKMAEAWQWTGHGDAWTVATEGGETVSIAAQGGVLSTAESIRCTCLLSPRCVHIAAVATLLQVADEHDGGKASSPGEEPAPSPSRKLSVGETQRGAARRVWETGARLLAAGASAAGTLLQGELLRGIHAARADGLHRLSGAGLRVVRRVRELREDSAAFSTVELHADLLELLIVADALSRCSVCDQALIGTARRAYEPIGSLRASGVLCEPLVTASGYAGVVSYVVDPDGRMFTVSDVMPGAADRALGAYDVAVKVGDASLSHRELCRAGMFLQNATASPDGRLGAGKGVNAVRAEGLGLGHPALAPRFREPYQQQRERVSAAMDDAAEERAAGSTLLYLRVQVVGAQGLSILAQAVEEPEALVRLGVGVAHEPLPFRDNLRKLAVAGLALRAVVRMPERGSILTLLAVAPDDVAEPGSANLELPAAWRGLCNVGFDRLQGSHVRGGEPAPRVEAPRAPDPLGMLDRWLVRALLGGRSGVPQAAMSAIRQDARRLEQAMMPGAARCVEALGRAASGHSSEELARAWVAGSCHARAAQRTLQ